MVIAGKLNTVFVVHGEFDRLAECAVCAHTLDLKNYDTPVPTTTTATWLSGPNGGVVTNPAEPALPLQIVNVTPIIPTNVLRGVGFRVRTTRRYGRKPGRSGSWRQRAHERSKEIGY